MISPRLQAFAIAAGILFLIMLAGLLKKNRLALKYSLLWIFSGLVMVVLAIFPGLLDTFSRLIGVYSSVNALFAVLLCIGMMLMISFTVIVSREKREIVRLVQEVSLLENRLRELEAEKTGERKETEKRTQAGTDPADGEAAGRNGDKPAAEETAADGTAAGRDGSGAEKTPGGRA